MPGLAPHSIAPPSQPVPALPAGTSLGPVSLTVSDLGRARDFYERVLGLRASESAGGGLALSGGGGRGPALIQLHADAAAPALDRRATGLFHLALLMPSRVALAHALLRLARERWPLDGASDHLVSEALYLSDPDGNGIELYRDRPREEWRYASGQLQMATLPLDLHSVAAELGPAPEPELLAPAETTMGHVHLQVSGLDGAEAFYHGVLGFDVVVRGYPGALFVSAGGYHHHLGLNTWNSLGSSPPAPGAVGLRSYEILLPGPTELQRVLDRIAAAGIPVSAVDSGGHAMRDPSGNGVVLSARAGCG